MNWNSYFIELADSVSKKSKDPNRKVGAIIVGPDNEIRSTGFNGFPRRVLEDFNVHDESQYLEESGFELERWKRPAKYDYVIHAELNAIINAARCGTAVNGCTLYMNWEPFPCHECAKAVINAGVIKVVGPARPFVNNNYAQKQYKDWNASIELTKTMFRESGISIKIVQDEI